MKEKLIELLGLQPSKDATEVTDDQVIAAVMSLQKAALEETDVREYERAIAKKITESGGALSRAMAIEVLKSQAVDDDIRAKRDAAAAKAAKAAK